MIYLVPRQQFKEEPLLHFHADTEHFYIVDSYIYINNSKSIEAMYIYRNNEARFCNRCCSGNAISIACSECVFVTLIIQSAMSMRHIVICGLSGSAVLFGIIIQTVRFSKEKVIENVICV